MLLRIRPLAVRAAVVAFFAVGIVGSLSGLAPYTCCRRAVWGAAITYLVAAVAARAVNAILFQVVVAEQIRKETAGADRS